MTTFAPAEHHLSADQARIMALRAQGLCGPAHDSPGTMLRHLGAVQLDTISVLARSHELVAYARLGRHDRRAIEDAYWGGGAFEYWSHAACILPLESWPLFSFRRRSYLERGMRWHEVPTQVLDGIRSQLRDEGPLTTKDLGGAKQSSYWWDWSAAKVGVEWLLDIGEVVVAQRKGWRRIYDLAERAIPDNLLNQDLTNDECLTRLIGEAGRTLGVGTLKDIADVHRLKVTDIRRLLHDTDLVPVSVQGWSEPAYADPGALDTLSGRGSHRTVMLSPFDSLIWFRERAERIFAMSHRLEAYTPAAKRVHGYFAMPVLHKGKLVARVDPARIKTPEGVVLQAKTVTLQTDRDGKPVKGAMDGVEAALAEAASWVDAVAYEIWD